MAQDTEAHSGHGRHLSDGLGHTDGKGIHHSSRIAHTRAYSHNGQTYNGVKAHRHGDAGKDRDEREPLLKQADGGGGQSDDGEEYGDDNHPGLALEDFQQGGH